MKKVIILLVAMFILSGILLNSSLILAQEDSGNSDKENSGNENDSEIESESEDSSNEEGETEIETEIEIEDERGELKRKIKIKSKEIYRERIQEAIQIRNRLRIHEAGAELAENCRRNENVLICNIGNSTIKRTINITAGNSGKEIIVSVGESRMKTETELYQDGEKVYGVFEGDEAREIKILPDEIRAKIRERIHAELEANEAIELESDGTYQIQVKKKSRFLGIIPVKENMNIELDSETGEIIRQSTPWWSFFARDVQE